jgi:hypothetical protein
MNLDNATRTAALRFLNSATGRDLARVVIHALKEGRKLDAPDVIAMVLTLGEPDAVAVVAGQSIVLRAGAALLLQHVEAERTRVRALEPVAHVVIGRLRRR